MVCSKMDAYRINIYDNKFRLTDYDYGLFSKLSIVDSYKWGYHIYVEYDNRRVHFGEWDCYDVLTDGIAHLYIHYSPSMEIVNIEYNTNSEPQLYGSVINGAVSYQTPKSYQSRDTFSEYSPIGLLNDVIQNHIHNFGDVDVIDRMERAIKSIEEYMNARND